MGSMVSYGPAWFAVAVAGAAGTCATVLAWVFAPKHLRKPRRPRA